MANKRISELASAGTLTVNDLLVLVNDAQTRKTTIQDLIDFLIAQGEFAQLDGGTIPPEQLPDLTTTDVAEGTRKYYTAARVLAEVLVGLDLQNAAVISTDSVLSALGKLQGQMNEREDLTKKGAIDGYASLDGTGKVPTTQLPASVLGGVSYQGTWNATSTLATPSVSNKGWYYVANADSPVNIYGTDWKIGDWAISNGTAWQKVDNSDPGIQEVLTGFVTGANSTILATDTVLAALQKVQGQITAREEISKKGALNGYAGLDGSGKVPAAQLPAFVIHQGTWNGATALATPSASNKGWYYVLNGNSPVDIYGTEWKVGDWAISNGAAWQKVDNSDPGITEVLTGFVTGANSTVLATDTVLAAIQKVQGQINAREQTSKKGVANGYASLDGNVRLTKAQLTRGQRALDLDTSASSASGTTETKVYSCPVNSDVFVSGDQLNVTSWFSATANANAKTLKLYFNTSDSLSGATLIGTYTVPSTVGSFKFERQISFVSAITAKTGAAPATSSAIGESTALDAAFTIPNITSTFYVLIGATKGVSGDTLRCERVAMEALYWTTADPITG